MERKALLVDSRAYLLTPHNEDYPQVLVRVEIADATQPAEIVSVVALGDLGSQEMGNHGLKWRRRGGATTCASCWLAFVVFVDGQAHGFKSLPAQPGLYYAWPRDSASVAPRSLSRASSGRVRPVNRVHAALPRLPLSGRALGRLRPCSAATTNDEVYFHFLLCRVGRTPKAWVAIYAGHRGGQHVSEPALLPDGRLS